MSDTPGISDAEWTVMEVVWETAPVAAADVVEQLAQKQDWHERTIKTMLSRLVRKGALTYEVEGNRYLYRPRVSREQSTREASRSFLRRFFHGDAVSAMAHLVEGARLSSEDLERLKQLLKENR